MTTKTILLECNKNLANSNDSTNIWRNNLDKGVVLNAGDVVSISSVVVEDKNLDANAVEISSNVNKFGAKMNEFGLKVAYYINNCGQYSVKLPFSKATVNFPFKDATVNVFEYGVLDDTTFIESMVKTTVLANSPTRFDSLPYYFLIDKDRYKIDGYTGIDNPLSYDFSNTTLLTRTIKSTLTNSFYTPSQLAAKITEFWNKSYPLESKYNNEDLIIPRDTYVANGATLPVLQFSGDNCMLMYANGVYPTNPPSGYTVNKFYNTTAYKEPFRVKYGNILLFKVEAIDVDIPGTSYNTSVLNRKGESKNDIFLLYDTFDYTLPHPTTNAPQNTSQTIISENQLLISNIKYTEANIKLISDFFNNTKKYIGDEITLKTALGDYKWTTKCDINIIDDSIGMWNQGAKTLALPPRTYWTTYNNTPVVAATTPLLATFNIYTNYSDYLFNEVLNSVSNSKVFDTGQANINKNLDGNMLSLAKKYNVACFPAKSNNLQKNYTTIAFIISDTTTIDGHIKHGKASSEIMVLRQYDRILYDFSFCRNPAIIPMNADKTNGDVGHTHNVNVIQIGAPSPALIYDSLTNHSHIAGLHFQNKIGNLMVNTPNLESNTGQIIISDDKQITMFKDVGGTAGEPQVITSLTSAVSGLGIIDIVLYKKDLIVNDNGKTIQQKLYVSDNPEYFKDTPLSRMGFVVSDLIGTYGVVSGKYNDIIQKAFNSSTREYMLKIFTTQGAEDTALNGSINIIRDTGLPVGSGKAILINGVSNGFPVNLQVSSCKIIATNPPDKLLYPVFLIQSNIIPTIEYYQNSNRSNTIYVLNRSYVSGNMIYGDGSTSTRYTVSKPHSITDIETKIIYPNGDIPTNLGDNCIITYKIEKQSNLNQTIDINQLQVLVENGIIKLKK